MGTSITIIVTISWILAFGFLFAVWRAKSLILVSCALMCAAAAIGWNHLGEPQIMLLVLWILIQAAAIFVVGWIRQKRGAEK